MKKISWYYKKLIFILKKRTDIDKKIIKYNSLNDLFNYFQTDKGSKNPYNKNSNEVFGHGFGEFYEKHFEKFKNEKINLLEIGTSYGASLAAFMHYFPNANIFGLDRLSVILESISFSIFFSILSDNFNPSGPNNFKPLS